MTDRIRNDSGLSEAEIYDLHTIGYEEDNLDGTSLAWSLAEIEYIHLEEEPNV